LGQFGYLAGVSKFMHDGLGHTTANVLVGIMSAIIDNIPVMFAVLTMDPQMSHGQYLHPSASERQVLYPLKL